MTGLELGAASWLLLAIPTSTVGRACSAAATRLRSEAVTSSTPRVLIPQSGLTRSWCATTAFMATRRVSVCVIVGASSTRCRPARLRHQQPRRAIPVCHPAWPRPQRPTARACRCPLWSGGTATNPIRRDRLRRSPGSSRCSLSLPRAILGPGAERLSSRADLVSDRIEHQHHQVNHIVAGQSFCAVQPCHQKLIGGGNDTERKHVYIA